MKSSCLPALVLALLAFSLGLATLLGASAPAFGEGQNRDKLEAHPMADAKAGEYLRFMVAKDGYKKWYVERILGVREGEVLHEVRQTSEDGSQDKQVIRRGWRKIRPLKAAKWQEVVKDEMVELEVDGKTLWCRHFVLNEREHRDWPEPKRRKEVWYSNDIPVSGKVKDSLSGRIVTSWGQMSAEETQRRKKAFEDSQKHPEVAPN